MKKIVSFFAVVICWMLCVGTVKADVIWEPYDDIFYMANRDDCQYVNRNYTANGPENKVIVYKSPENPTVTETWENGHVVNIYYTWTDEDGIVWGMYNDWETDETGWMPMDYMDVVYDYICFEEEFGDSFVEEMTAIPGEYAGKSIFFWSYPGADIYREIPMPEAETEMPQCSTIFVDEEGHKWGYFGYFRGVRNMWVCLDQPVADASTLYPEGLPVRGGQMTAENTFAEDTRIESTSTEDTYKEDTYTEDTVVNEERISPSVDTGIIGLIICLILGVCGATGGVLLGMKKKKG